MAEYKRWAILGFISGVLLPFIFNFLSRNIISSVSIRFAILPDITLTPGFPNSIYSYFVNIVSLGATLPDYVKAGIVGAIVAVIGAFFYNLKVTPNARSQYGKVFLVLLYASMALAAFSWWMSGVSSFLPVLTIALINSAITAAFIVFVLAKFKAIKIP